MTRRTVLLVKFLPSLQQGTRIQAFDAFVNKISSEGQQRLVNAHRIFGDAYRFFVSGQQSSAVEALRILNTVAVQFGDNQQVIDQKRLMRETMIQAATDASQGLFSPLQAAEAVLERAKKLGFDKKALEAFTEQRNDACGRQQGDRGYWGKVAHLSASGNIYSPLFRTCFHSKAHLQYRDDRG